MSGDERSGDEMRNAGAADESLREAMAAYALGALGAADRAEVERAVAASPALATELRELSDVTALLALAAPPRALPPGLRARVMRDAAGSGTARVSDAAAASTARPSVQAEAEAAPPVPTSTRGTPARSATKPAEPERSGGFGTFVPWLLLAASLAGLAVTWRGQVTEREARAVAASEAAATQDALQRQVASLDSLVATLTASDLATVTLSSTGAPPSARLYWNRVRGEVLLAAFRLPQAPAGRTYQLWGIAPGAAPVSLGTFDSAGEGREVVRFVMPPGLQLAVGAVSEEPAGGSPQPTSAPFLVGTLRASE